MSYCAHFQPLTGCNAIDLTIWALVGADQFSAHLQCFCPVHSSSCCKWWNFWKCVKSLNKVKVYCIHLSPFIRMTSHFIIAGQAWFALGKSLLTSLDYSLVLCVLEIVSKRTCSMNSRTKVRQFLRSSFTLFFNMNVKLTCLQSSRLSCSSNDSSWIILSCVTITSSALSAPMSVSHLIPYMWTHLASLCIHQVIALPLIPIPLLPKLDMQRSSSRLGLKSYRQKWYCCRLFHIIWHFVISPNK